MPVTFAKSALGLLAGFSLLLTLTPARAATTINGANHSSYAANFGWMDWRGDGANGAVIGEFVCSGSIYAANIGWINLGSGSPADGIQYQNNSGTDFGVNHDGLGHLRGMAYSANIGWIVFTNATASGPLADEEVPRLNLGTGRFGGFAWSANCGWLSLSNAFGHVRTDTLRPGTDTDGDGIADAWELSRTNTLAAFTASSDTDGDSASDLAEYRADTNPLDFGDNLRITAFSTKSVGSSETNTLAWSSQPTRLYQVSHRTNLIVGVWVNTTGLFLPDVGTNTVRTYVVSGGTPKQRFYRVRAVKPLAP